MPKKLQKSIQDCLSKIKNPTPSIQLSSKNWILSGCKHTKTISFAVDDSQNQGHSSGLNNKDEAATLADIDRFLYENFKSLYIKNDDEQDHGNKSEEVDQVQSRSSGILFESPRLTSPPPDLSRSNRFFVAPASSSSLIEETRTSLTATSEDMGARSSFSTNTINESSISPNYVNNVTLPDDCIAVLEYSPSPYDDFRRSMQEMVEARLQHEGKVDWDFMEELLSCYMNLNEKKSRKFILSAFVDLISGLRHHSNRVPARPRPSRIARERRRRFRNM